MSNKWLLVVIIWLSINVCVVTAAWLQSWIVNNELLKRIHGLEKDIKETNNEQR